MRIVNTSGWDFDRIAPYGPEITTAMKKLQERFPKDISIEFLMQEIMAGKRDLWLILDDEDNFKSFVLTQINQSPTGNVTCSVLSMAGDDGAKAVPLISEIEKYGKEKGATETLVIGRAGWKRSLGKQGYKTDAMLFRKELSDG